jgi:ATP-dependent RNA helicase MSS116
MPIKSKRQLLQEAGAIDALTEIQARSIIPGIAGKDILAKSNTGSGKTLAFLIVAIERILLHKGPDPKTSFPVVVLTPVTDLATQITNVAKRLLKYHGMEADMVIGGTDEKKDIKRLLKDRIDVLVATPGRFKSILNQSPEIKQRLAKCQTFVIDEADKMTDPGFLGDTKFIHNIAKSAKSAKMQTMMFSATMDKVRLVSLGLLKDDVVLIDAASGTKPQVNTKVRQVSIVTDVSNHLDALIHVVDEQIKMKQNKKGGNAQALIVELDPKKHKLSAPTLKALKEWEMPLLNGYRIMIFLPSNAFIDYFAEVFSKQMPKVKMFVLHGGLTQAKRSQTSEAFRTTDDCILFTSDASARGVDYPDVSCVVQIGFDSRAEYLQRVGRTGRAGKDGSAFLITSQQENVGVELVCDVLTDLYVESGVSAPKCSLKSQVYKPFGVKYPQGLNPKGAKKALGGWLGSLASKWKRLKMTPASVMSLAQSLSKAIGVDIDDKKLMEKLSIKIKP